MKCDNCKEKEATRTSGFHKKEYEEYTHWCDECYGKIWVMDFINYNIENAITGWEREIRDLETGGCGTLWTEDTVPYRESKIKDLEEMRQFIKERMK